MRKQGIIAASLYLPSPLRRTARLARPAWERVRDGGSYRYYARVDIALRPMHRLENVGLHTTHQQLAIEG